jgi:ribosomal protein S18 acetylase RimI-like enzyme
MDPDEADVLRAIAERDFIETWSLFGRLPDASLVDEGGVLRLVTGAADPLANAVLRTRVPAGADADAAIDAAIARFEADGLPWTWWSLPSDEPEDLVARVERRGVIEFESAPLMTLTDLRSVTDRAVAGLVIDRVRDEPDLDAFLAVAEGALELSPAVGRLLRELAVVTGLGDDAPIRHYVGRIDGRIVGIATLHLGSWAGVYNVGTLESVRGRGIGTALTTATLVDARSAGLRVAALQSSDLGLGVYERLGFVEVGTVRALGRIAGA